MYDILKGLGVELDPTFPILLMAIMYLLFIVSVTIAGSTWRFTHRTFLMMEILGCILRPFIRIVDLLFPIFSNVMTQKPKPISKKV